MGLDSVLWRVDNENNMKEILVLIAFIVLAFAIGSFAACPRLEADRDTYTNTLPVPREIPATNKVYAYRVARPDLHQYHRYAWVVASHEIAVVVLEGPNYMHVEKCYSPTRGRWETTTCPSSTRVYFTYTDGVTGVTPLEINLKPVDPVELGKVYRGSIVQIGRQECSGWCRQWRLELGGKSEWTGKPFEQVR